MGTPPLVANIIRRGIDTVFPLYTLELFKRVRGSLAAIADLHWRTRCSVGFLRAPVNFAIFCDAIREPLRWGHLAVWFAHFVNRFIPIYSNASPVSR